MPVIVAKDASELAFFGNHLHELEELRKYGYEPATLHRYTGNHRNPSNLQLIPNNAPSIDTGGIPSEVMVGEAFTFDIVFGADASITGYGPIIDVVFPVVGVGGDPSNPNGFDFNSATYLGNSIDCASASFIDNGGLIQATHPYGRDSSDEPVLISGSPDVNEGDKLVSCKLPFASFVPSQPNARVTYHALQLGPPYPEVGSPLPIHTRAGFVFGDDHYNNPISDPSIFSHPNNVGSWPDKTIEPILITIYKTFTNMDWEMTSGPNFEGQFTVTVDIAAGRIITDLDLTDVLPDDLQFKAVIHTKIGSTNTPTTAISTPSTSVPGGTLTRRFTSVTGTSATNDATMTFSVYVPRDVAGGATQVIDLGTGIAATSENEAQASGNWNPDDGSGPAMNPATVTCPSPCFSLSDRAIAIQKESEILFGWSTMPGATIEHRIKFQISDFFGFEDIVVSDKLSDGQHWDGIPPTMTVTEHGATSTGTMLSDNYTVDTSQIGNDVDPSTDGSTTITFRVSDELGNPIQPTPPDTPPPDPPYGRGLDPQILGGCVPAGGTGDASTLPDCASGNLGATTGEIVFRTIIQNHYSDTYESGDASFDQGDEVKNDVSILGTVLNYANLSATINIPSDDSTTTINAPFSEPVAKSIYAINFSTTFTSPLHVSAGDVITFKLEYETKTSNFEDLVFTDYLPLPIMDVDDPKGDGSPANWPLKVSNFCPLGTSPMAGEICYSPQDTFYAYSFVQPTVTANSVSNTLEIEYGSYDNPVSQGKTISLLFSIAVNRQPYHDGPNLANLIDASESSTQNAISPSEDIAGFVLDEPDLVIQKSLVATDNLYLASLDPTLAGYTFKAPETAGPRWTSPMIIDSPYLINNPINSDLINSGGSDLVTYAIVIENQTSAGVDRGGAFDITIKDSLPVEMRLPDPATYPNGLNLDIRLGNGDPVSYYRADGTPSGDTSYTPDPGTGTELFNDGLILVDLPGGACQAHASGSGKSVVILTYDLQIDPTVFPSTVISNTASLTNYANDEGGADFTAVSDLEEAAQVTTVSAMTKTVASSSDPHTRTAAHRAGIEDLMIGEQVTFSIVATLPEGNSTGVTVVDNLPTELSTPAGVLSVVSSCVSSIGSKLTLSNNPAGTCPTEFGVHADTDLDANAYPDQVVFDFGDVTNMVDGVLNADDRIWLEVVARVEAHAANQEGGELINQAVMKAGTQTFSTDLELDLVVYPVVLSTDLVDSYAANGGPTSFTITFSENLFDPPNDTNNDDVTNAANYLLLEEGNLPGFQTSSCNNIDLVNDTRLTVDNVNYISGTFTAVIGINGGTPLPIGTYRLFICGTTSIVDLTNNRLNGGADSVFDFRVSSRLPATGFAPGRITILPPQPVSKTYTSHEMILEIPKLELSMPIVGIPLVEGEWDATWLGNNAGYLSGSAFPTWPGNTVLTGHVWDAWNQPGPFAELKKLQHGDRVFIHAWDMVYTYEVRENRLYWTTGKVQRVFQHEEYDWVTLLTCEFYNPLSEDYFFRRAVRAVLISVK